MGKKSKAEAGSKVKGTVGSKKTKQNQPKQAHAAEVEGKRRKEERRAERLGVEGLEKKAMVTRGSADRICAMKERMKKKLLERKLAKGAESAETEDPEARKNALRELGRLHASHQRNEQAIEQYEKLLEMDPSDPLDCSTHYLTLLMDDTQSDKARALLEKNDALRKSAVGAYTLALIEYISAAVLEEEGSDFDKATELLKKAVRKNPLIAEFIAWNSVFIERFDPGTLDEILGWDKLEAPLDIALQYVAVYGQFSVWGDVEGAHYWVRNKIFADAAVYEKYWKPKCQIEGSKRTKKVCPEWENSREEWMDRIKSAQAGKMSWFTDEEDEEEEDTDEGAEDSDEMMSDEP